MTWRTSPDDGSAQCGGHPRDNMNMKDDTHHSRTYSFEQGERMIMTTMIFGDLEGLKLPDICLAGEEKPHQETCPDRGSNPGPLRDRRVAIACSTAVYTGPYNTSN